MSYVRAADGFSVIFVNINSNTFIHVSEMLHLAELWKAKKIHSCVEIQSFLLQIWSDAFLARNTDDVLARRSNAIKYFMLPSASVTITSKSLSELLRGKSYFYLLYYRRCRLPDHRSTAVLRTSPRLPIEFPGMVCGNTSYYQPKDFISLFLILSSLSHLPS